MGRSFTFIILFFLCQLLAFGLMAQEGESSTLSTITRTDGIWFATEVERLARKSPNEGIIVAQQAAAFFKQHPQPRLEGRVLNATSYAYYFLGKYDLSMEHAKKAEYFAKKHNVDDVLARAYMLQGNVLQTISDYQNSISKYQQAVLIYSQLGNDEFLGYCYNNMANTYERAGNYSIALEYYEKYKDLATNDSGHASADLGIGDVLLAQKKIPEALKAYQKALEQYTKEEDKLGIAFAMNAIGEALVEKSEYNKALAMFEQVLASVNESHLEYIKVPTMHRMARSLNYLGIYADAEHWVSEAITLASALGEKSELAISYQTQSEIFAAQGKDKQALEALKTSRTLQSEFNNELARTKLTVMKALFESEAKEAQIAELEEQNRLLNLQREISQKRSENAWLTAALLFFMLGFLALWAMYMQREKSRLAILSKQLTIARHQAEAATEAKSAFLARMSHELRTPINAITGLSRLALETRSTNEQRSHLLHVLDAGEILLRLVDDILDFSRIEAGKLAIEVIPFAPRELVKCAQNMQILQARAKGLKLKEKISPDLPAQLLGDPWRIKQILINLVSNAVKFTESGQVTIELSTRPLPDNPELVMLEGAVSDTGIGLSQDQQDALFQSFSQADDSITRRYGGTGLGLAICKQLCDLMHGQIWVESAAGQGATFRFSLPLKQVQEAPLEATELTSEPVIPDWSEYRLLLVEDNEVNRQVALGILHKTGIDVVVAENGQQAISKLQSEFFDAVLMDIQMPVMDGLTAAVIIRQDMELQIPIIAMTAHAMEADRQKSLKAGMNGHLSKPFDHHSLFSILAEHLPTERTVAIAEVPTDNLQGWQNEQLAGLDVQQSITRLGGNTELYRTLLCSFYRDQQNTPLQLRQHVADAQFNVLFRLVHSLKSSSAYIGALGISAQCSTLEPILEHGPCDRRAVLAIADDLENLLTTLAPMLKEQSEQQPPTSEVNLMEELRQVLDLLKQSDFTVEDKLAVLINMMQDSPFAERLAEVAQKVEEVEYERAATLTKALLKELQGQENINTDRVMNS